MALYANYPIALAPGMSLNAYFTYSVCLGMGIPWQTALGVVFLSGALFFVLTVTRVREHIVNGIPESLKHSHGGGHRPVHRVRRPAQRKTHRGESGNARDALANSRSRIAARLLWPRAHRRADGAQSERRDPHRHRSDHAARHFSRRHALAHAILSLPHPAGTWLKLDLRGALHLGLIELIFVFLVCRSF